MRLVVMSALCFMTVFQSYLLFDDLDRFENTGQVFSRRPLSLGLSSGFLMVRQLWVLGREYHRGEVPSFSYDIRGFLN